MTDEPRDPPEGEAPELPEIAALLKRSLDRAPEAAEPGGFEDRHLLRGVQKRLRERSRGKFYGDGWSTSSSRINYGHVALVMLVMVVAVYLALGPTGFSR